MINDEKFIGKVLHEAGREAVLKNKVLKKDGAPIGEIKFKEWDDLPSEAQEGRIIQAKYLLEHFFILDKTQPVTIDDLKELI